ncbi:hypothetical protein D3C80_2150740 [compost metagenome]
MAWAVGNEGDLLAVGLAISARAQLIEQSTNAVNDLQIGFLVPAANVVDLAHRACL